MRKTRQQARETRDQILDAAEHLFAEHGVSRTSLEDIAMRAGFTRGAIYGYFRNKSDLFVAMTNRVMLPMEMLVASTADSPEQDPLGRIRQLFVYFLGKVAVEPHNRRVLEVLFTKCENTRDMVMVLERQHDAARNGKQHLERGLRNAIAKGQLPEYLDTERAACVVHAFLSGVLRDWLLERDAIMLPRDAAFVTDVCIGMLMYLPSLRRESCGARDNADRSATL